MKKKFKIILLLSLLNVLLWGSHSFAQTKKSLSQSKGKVTQAQVTYEQLAKSYQRLILSDPKVKDVLVWERLGAKMLKSAASLAEGKYLGDKPTNELTTDYTGEIYFLLGDLYQNIYEKKQSRDGLSKATYFFRTFSSRFKGHRRAPEALLRLGDLRRSGIQDEVGANAAYQELLQSYPSSDAAKTARKRAPIRVGIELPPSPNTEEFLDAQIDSTKEQKQNLSLAGAEEEKKGTGSELGNKSFLSKIFGNELFGNEDENALGREVYKLEASPKRPTIVIDAGHGGDEHGAIGVEGVPEKEIVLNIAKYLGELLRERLRANVYFTREVDKTLSLAERTKIANDRAADLFVSIHANASEYKNVKGIETYYLDNTNDKSSLKLAQRENASLQQTSTDLGFIISDFIQSAKLDDSIALAHHIQDGTVKSVSRYFQGTKDLGVKKAPFYVLVGAHMPCVLVEVSFIDHPVEGARLITSRYQKIVAVGIYQGIKAYFGSREK